MLAGNTVALGNGLRISIDWLSWTLKEPCSVKDALSMMGYSMADFQLLPTGLNGYRSKLRHNVFPISIQYDGREGMGIHVDVSGSAIADVMDHFFHSRLVSTPFGSPAYETASFDYTVLHDILTSIKDRGHITRLDLAIDDYGSAYYSMNDLHNIFSTRQFVSKFRNWKELVKYHGSDVAGHTIYLGSRTSDIMLRIYDKHLETTEKALANGLAPDLTPWVRWELELKKDRAIQAADLIISGNTVATVAVGILSNYLRIIELDNTRSNRCSISEKWNRFIDGISKLRLYRQEPAKTLDDMKHWLERQVAPTLATVTMSDGGSIDYLYNLLELGSCRLKKHQVNIIRMEGGKTCVAV